MSNGAVPKPQLRGQVCFRVTRSTLSCAAVGLPVWLIPRLQAQLGTAVAAGSDLLVPEISIYCYYFDFVLFFFP